MKPSEVLKAARQLITPPEKWTQGVFAINADGESSASPWLGNPVCFCSLGAIENIIGTDHWYAKGVIDYLSVSTAPDFIEKYNDSHSHTEVLAAFDKAIALAESEGN